MTAGADRDDAQGKADAAMAARHNWIADQLGEQWRSDGDGVYRFAGPTEEPTAPPSSDTPHEDDELIDETPLLPWLDEPESETPPTSRPRTSHLPWRRG